MTFLECQKSTFLRHKARLAVVRQQKQEVRLELLGTSTLRVWKTKVFT